MTCEYTRPVPRSLGILGRKECGNADDFDRTPGGGGYGQNLAYWGATDGHSLGAAGAVKKAVTTQWYNGELNDYSPHFYGNEPDMSNFATWGHFSQLVWVDTTTVGCAVHYCEAGTISPNIGVWYSVCNYHPAGKFPSPVFRPHILRAGARMA